MKKNLINAFHDLKYDVIVYVLTDDIPESAHQQELHIRFLKFSIFPFFATFRSSDPLFKNPVGHFNSKAVRGAKRIF